MVDQTVMLNILIIIAALSLNVLLNKFFFY